MKVTIHPLSSSATTRAPARALSFVLLDMTSEQPPTSTPAFLPPVTLRAAEYCFYHKSTHFHTPAWNSTVIFPLHLEKNPNTSPWPISPYIIWLQLISLTLSGTSLHAAHYTAATLAFFCSLMMLKPSLLRPFVPAAHSGMLFPQTLSRLTSHHSELSLKCLLPREISILHHHHIILLCFLRGTYQSLKLLYYFPLSLTLLSRTEGTCELRLCVITHFILNARNNAGCLEGACSIKSCWMNKCMKTWKVSHR